MPNANRPSLVPPTRNNQQSKNNSLQPNRVSNIETELKIVRQKFEDCFHKFNSLLADKTLKINKSEAKVKNESHIADQLYRAAAELEMKNQTEGLFGLAIMFLRLQLKMRDRINELEYEFNEFKKQNKK